MVWNSPEPLGIPFEHTNKSQNILRTYSRPQITYSLCFNLCEPVWLDTEFKNKMKTFEICGPKQFKKGQEYLCRYKSFSLRVEL